MGCLCGSDARYIHMLHRNSKYIMYSEYLASRTVRLLIFSFHIIDPVTDLDFILCMML